MTINRCGPIFTFVLTKLSAEQIDALRAVPLGTMANKIRVAIALAQVQQVDIVRSTGLPAPNVSNIVNGRYQALTVDTARKFADFFGVAIEDLFPPKQEAA